MSLVSLNVGPPDARRCTQYGSPEFGGQLPGLYKSPIKIGPRVAFFLLNVYRRGDIR